MSDEDKKALEELAKTSPKYQNRRYIYAAMAALAELTALRAIVERVHAEMGPSSNGTDDTRGREWFICKSCYHESISIKTIAHAPDCLWKAADEWKRGQHAR